MARKRAVLYNLLGYAADRKLFTANPLASLNWKTPRTAEAIDRTGTAELQAKCILGHAIARGGAGGRLAGPGRTLRYWQTGGGSRALIGFRATPRRAA